MGLFKIKIIVILIVSLSSGAYAQQFLSISKTEFKTKDEGFKEAWKNLNEGNDAFIQDIKGTYKIALNHYLEANRYNPNTAKLNYLIGICYLNTINKNNAMSYLKKAFNTNEFVSNDVQYWLAIAYQLNYKFKLAKEHLKKYKQNLSPNELLLQSQTIKKRIEECKNGINLLNNPTRVFIDNMGSAINSEYPEYSPVISADEDVLYYTSRRPETMGNKKDPIDFEYYEDIYISLKAQGEWLESDPLSKPINTKYHDATVSLAPDGQSLFIFRSSKGGGILESVLDGEDWSFPAPLPRTINSSKYENSACLASDGKTVYFVRQGEENPITGEAGDKDIYVSTKNPITQQWSEGKALSSVVNTDYDEDAVFIHPDGRTLFFSSKGHNGMGGFDIFKTELDENGRFTKPQNLGYPINTTDDDIFFVLAANGKYGYFSSVRPDGFGDQDIYKITFLSPENLILNTEDNLIASIAKPISALSVEKAIEIKKIRLTIVKGLINEALTSEAIGADIEIIDNEKNEIVFQSQSNSSTGKYLVALPSGKNYGLVVKAHNYLFHSENFDIPASSEYQVIEKNIELLSLEIGSKVILKNIFFETGSAKLKNESNAELYRIIKLMKTYPSIKIEISGHTDNIGSEKVNLQLSENRAKAVVDYIIKQGISKSNLSYKGKGFKHPIASNKTSIGRQKNRRVEFEIIENN